MGRINNINKYKQTELTGETIILGSRKPFGETVNYDINDIAQYISQFIEGGGTTPMNQNNRVIMKNIYYTGSDKIEDKVNAQNLFEVKEDEILILLDTFIKEHIEEVNGLENVVHTLLFKHYLFKKGKGLYGDGGDITTSDDYYLLKETNAYTFPDSDPIVYTVVTNDVYNPSEAVNNSFDSYNIESSTDVYFHFIDDKEFNQSIYRFVGDSGIYGNGGSLSEPEDFLIIEVFNSDSEYSQSKTSDLINDGELGRLNERYITSLDLPRLLSLQSVTSNGNETDDSVISKKSFIINSNDNNSYLGGLHNYDDSYAYLELGDDADNRMVVKNELVLFRKNGVDYKISTEGDTSIPSIDTVYRLPLQSGRLVTDEEFKSDRVELDISYPEWGIHIGDTQNQFNTKVFEEVESKIDEEGGTMIGNLSLEKEASLSKSSDDNIVTLLSPISANYNTLTTGAIVLSHPYTVSGRIQMEVSVSKRQSSEDKKEKYYISFSVENSSTIGSQDLQAICVSNNGDVKDVRVGFNGSDMVVVIDSHLLSESIDSRRITVDNIVIMGDYANDESWKSDWSLTTTNNLAGYTLTSMDTYLISSDNSSIEHNTLTGLQGGTTGEYYHLTEAEYDKVGGRVVIPLIEFELPSSTSSPDYENFAALDIMDICPVVDMNYVDWEIVWGDVSGMYKLSGNKDYIVSLKWSSGNCFQIEGKTGADNGLNIREDMNPKLILYY